MVECAENRVLRRILEPNREEKHNRSGMVAVLGPFEALPYYIHT
jgi:hypothetical protein